MPARGRDLAERLNSATVHLARAVRQAAKADRGAETLSAESLSALLALVYQGPQAIGALARSEGVTAPAMTKTVGLLQARGLVAKEADSADRRVVRIRATRRGMAMVVRRRHAQIAGIRKALLAVGESPAEIERAIQILERVVAGLEA